MPVGQPAEAIFFPVPDGVTEEELVAWFDKFGDSGQFPEDPGPLGEGPGGLPMSAGVSSVLQLPLQPGRYVIIDWLSDAQDGRMLLKKGALRNHPGRLSTRREPGTGRVGTPATPGRSARLVPYSRRTTGALPMTSANTPEPGFVTFGVLRTDSPEAARRLVGLITGEVDRWVRHTDGFHSARTHVSLDGTTVVQWGRWADEKRYRDSFVRHPEGRVLHTLGERPEVRAASVFSGFPAAGVRGTRGRPRARSGGFRGPPPHRAGVRPHRPRPARPQRPVEEDVARVHLGEPVHRAGRHDVRQLPDVGGPRRLRLLHEASGHRRGPGGGGPAGSGTARVPALHRGRRHRAAGTGSLSRDGGEGPGQGKTDDRNDHAEEPQHRVPEPGQNIPDRPGPAVREEVRPADPGHHRGTAPRPVLALPGAGRGRRLDGRLAGRAGGPGQRPGRGRRHLPPDHRARRAAGQPHDPAGGHRRRRLRARLVRPRPRQGGVRAPRRAQRPSWNGRSGGWPPAAGWWWRTSTTCRPRTPSARSAARSSRVTSGACARRGRTCGGAAGCPRPSPRRG
ncbi:hypothetical protein LV779_25475 [Streptomyces thinghirensis]|nr:hypothetical protein [Streptomyces thinghirensis]